MSFGQLLELPQQIESIEAWQSQVQEDQLKMVLFGQLQRSGGLHRAGQLDIIIVQQCCEQIRQARIVFDQ